MIPQAATLLHSSLLSSLAAFQAQDVINSGNAKLLEVFIAIAAIALLAQAIVVVGIGIGAFKVYKLVNGHIGELRAKAMPIIEKSQALVEQLTPQIHEITAKVNNITGHVEEIVGMAKDKALEFSPTISAANLTVAAANETVRDANLKTREQVTRVNGMISGALDATVRLGHAIEHGITQPGREIAGVLSGVKAGLSTLTHAARGFAASKSTGTSRPPATPYREATEPTMPRNNKPDLGL